MIEGDLEAVWDDFLTETGAEISGDTSDNTQEYYSSHPEESEENEWKN